MTKTKQDDLRAAIYKNYIKIQKAGAKYNCLLQINHQSFYIIRNETKTRCIWFGEMLSNALAVLVMEERER